MMERLVVKGGKKLKGEVFVSGSKNVALKTLVAACLTEEEVTIENIPLISDFYAMTEIIKGLGGKVTIHNHTAKVQVGRLRDFKISLEKAAEIRTSSMFFAPLIWRMGVAQIPNPGGCRIGARPIDRIIDGLKAMGISIRYSSDDGYFTAKAKAVNPIRYRFKKNTHTGTETLLLTATLAQGRTILENAAMEPEVDDLIDLLNAMGAKVKRVKKRTIIIDGVKRLHGTKYSVGPDRNEVVTFAIAALLTNGDIRVKGIRKPEIKEFLEQLEKTGGGFEQIRDGIRFYSNKVLKPTRIVTTPYPGFMTDWQGPWAILMTQARGISKIHETVYESRFGYIDELKRMGAQIESYRPQVENPEEFYNFNRRDDKKENVHAIRIFGPIKLHNAVVHISDLRAGATLVLAALGAKGESIIFGVEHLDRGYERFDERLRTLGADIKRIQE